MADDDTTTETTEEETTTTDEEVVQQADRPDAVKAALQRERDAAKEAKKQADTLAAKVKEYEDRDKSEQEKAAERLKDLESKAQGAELKALRFEVAAAKGVPLTQAHRLQGSTKEELEADADDFLKDVKQPTTDFEGGPRGTADTPQDMDALIRHAAGYR